MAQHKHTLVPTTFNSSRTEDPEELVSRAAMSIVFQVQLRRRYLNVWLLPTEEYVNTVVSCQKHLKGKLKRAGEAYKNWRSARKNHNEVLTHSGKWSEEGTSPGKGGRSWLQEGTFWDEGQSSSLASS